MSETEAIRLAGLDCVQTVKNLFLMVCAYESYLQSAKRSPLIYIILINILLYCGVG